MRRLAMSSTKVIAYLIKFFCRRKMLLNHETRNKIAYDLVLEEFGKSFDTLFIVGKLAADMTLLSH